jgi:hypothetical protein
MLKLRALNKLVTLNKTPGLFSTSAATMCHDSASSCEEGLDVVDAPAITSYAPVIMSLRPVPGATKG